MVPVEAFCGCGIETSPPNRLGRGTSSERRVRAGLRSGYGVIGVLVESSAPRSLFGEPGALRVEEKQSVGDRQELIPSLSRRLNSWSCCIPSFSS